MMTRNLTHTFENHWLPEKKGLPDGPSKGLALLAEGTFYNFCQPDLSTTLTSISDESFNWLPIHVPPLIETANHPQILGPELKEMIRTSGLSPLHVFCVGRQVYMDIWVAQRGGL